MVRVAGSPARIQGSIYADPWVYRLMVSRVKRRLRRTPPPLPNLMDSLTFDGVLVLARHRATKKRHPYPDGRLARLQRRLYEGTFGGYSAPRWYQPPDTDKLCAVQCTTDKIVGTATAMVLGAVWDPYRSPDAYGWGKGRGAHQVIRVIRSELADSDSVVGTDIASCFEEIPHDLIFRQLTPIVSDDLFLALLRSYLHSVQSAPGRGVGRGTTLAPLLADIALANIPLNPADWPDFCPDPACTLHTCTQSPTPASPETIPWRPRGGAPRPVKGSPPCPPAPRSSIDPGPAPTAPRRKSPDKGLTTYVEDGDRQERDTVLGCPGLQPELMTTVEVDLARAASSRNKHRVAVSDLHRDHRRKIGPRAEGPGKLESG